MSNLTKLEFTALDISGKNFLAWVLDAEIHLESMNLGEAIKAGNNASPQERAKAMIFLRHHLHEELKSEYLTVKDPQILWSNLQERYEHQKTIILPRARYEWMHLRLQDFKTVSEYNSAMFKISSTLMLCGEKMTDRDMLEKTYSTFHASNVLLQQQYRERQFTKYSELISCLLVAEQNNELLMKNHHSRPTGSVPVNEMNMVTFEPNGQNRGQGYGGSRGGGCGRGRGNKGRGKGFVRNRGGNKFSNKSTYAPNVKKWNNKPFGNKGKGALNKSEQVFEEACFRCGMKGHWSKICRTPKYFVDLYQASLKGKGKEVDMNYVNFDDLGDFTHLETSDFYETLPVNDDKNDNENGHIN